MIGWIEKIASEFREKPKPRSIPASLFSDGQPMGFPDEWLPFDLLVSESHSLQFDISEHRVETGTPISDCINERLRRVTVSGIFTNHPVGTEGAYVDSNGNRIEGHPDKIEIEGRTPVMNTALDRWNRLKELAHEKRTVRLVTAMETYGEMAIESLSSDRSGRDGEAVRFSVSLREIRTASAKVLRIEATWNPPEPKTQDKPEKRAMKKKKNKGRVPATGVSAEEIGQKLGKSTRPETAGGL